MKEQAKKANIMAAVLSVIFLLTFFNMFLPRQQENNPSHGDETEQTDPNNGGNNENAGGEEPTNESQFEKPPNLVTALSAWRYAESKLYELSHWESVVRDQNLRTAVSFAGQSIYIKRVWNGVNDATVYISSVLAPGKTFGIEFYEMQQRVGGKVLLRHTTKQTAARQPIWQNEGTLYTNPEFLAKRAILPADPVYIIQSSTVINGSKRTINDGQTITFSLELKAAACANYAIQITDASGSSTPAKFRDGDVRLDVVLSAKTGMFISVKATEKYNVTVMGMNSDVNLTGTEVYSNYRI